MSKQTLTLEGKPNVKLTDKTLAKEGGWKGYKKFTITNKEKENK